MQMANSLLRLSNIKTGDATNQIQQYKILLNATVDHFYPVTVQLTGLCN